MTTYLYEKDLRQMKYNIMISTGHERTVREIAAQTGINPQQLRLVMIRRFDMSLLENLPSRYESGRRHTDDHDPVTHELGCELFSRFIPLVEPTTMQTICSGVRTMISEGTPQDDAIAAGKARIREAILS